LNTDISRESRFEDRLLAAILDDFDRLAAPAANPRPAMRRRAVTALIATAAAAGVAAAVLAALGGRAPLPATTRGTEALASPKLQTAAHVVDHIDAALNANTAVVKIIEHAPDSQTGRPVIDEIWSTSLSPTYRIETLSPGGSPITGYLVSVTAHRTVSIAVNYGDRTWSRTTYPFGSASSPQSPSPRSETPLHQAAHLRAEVKAGRVTLDGRATVDGQTAIHLTEHLMGGLINLWVSPTTYLPIQEIDTARGVPPTSGQAIRHDYQWLPTTAANLRLLTPAAAIPAGFTQVSPNNEG
jgi:hypothetical protein